MKTQLAVLIVGVTLLAVTILPGVRATVFLTIVPAQPTVTQGSTSTSFGVTVEGLPNTAYSLSMSGLVGEFYPSPLETDSSGYGVAVFSVDFGAQAYAMNFGAPYCPGTYNFTITATGGLDSGSVSGLLTVARPGPIKMSVMTDKPAYTVGDEIMMRIPLDRAAHGTIALASPAGAVSYYSFFSTATTPTILTETFTATAPYGTWTATVRGNDFCGVVTSVSARFTVNPVMYSVSISLAGLPPSSSVSVQVDGANRETISGTKPSYLSFPNGTSHTISVDRYAPGTAGVRFHCADSTWVFSGKGHRTFQYETQYELTVQTVPAGVFGSESEWYDAGTIVGTNQAPQSVTAQTQDTKYLFRYWEVDGAPQPNNPVSNIVMSMPRTATANYATQYRLLVSSQNDLGSPQGSNFYNAGVTADFSVSTPVGTMIQQVFIQWTGDCTGTSPQGSILMDGPHEVDATWTTSYTQLYALAGTIAAAIAAAILLLRRRGNRVIAPGTSKDQQTVLLFGGSAPA